MARLNVVTKAVKEGKLGPALRLLPTTAATTLRGQAWCSTAFAETKEQLTGVPMSSTLENLDAALDVARDLSEANPTSVMKSARSHSMRPEARPTRPTQVVKVYLMTDRLLA